MFVGARDDQRDEADPCPEDVVGRLVAAAPPKLVRSPRR